MPDAVNTTRGPGETGVEVQRFERDGWQVRVFIMGRLESGAVTGYVDLYRSGEYKCRITTARHNSDEQLAVVDLREKALRWIEDWNSREHSGDTGFVSL